MKTLSLVLLWAAMAAGQVHSVNQCPDDCICDARTNKVVACSPTFGFGDPAKITTKATTTINPKEDLCHDKDGKDVCPPPRSVPAVRKTRKVCAEYEKYTICWDSACQPSCKTMKDELYWTCDDPSIPGGADRALIPSENNKKAMCLLIE